MTVLFILVLLIVFVAAVLFGVALMLPAVSEAQERVRIEREAQQASWRIHHQATRAFGQMLQATREDQGQ